MRIVVFGTGGAGGYFGAQLALAGEDVVFIARGEHLSAIRSKGLRLESPKGEAVIHPAQATHDSAQVAGVDVVLVGVKAWQVTEAAHAIQPMIGADTVVVPLQNGVEAAAQLAAALGPDHVLGGLCGTISWVAGAGHIRTASEHNFIKFGELDNRRSERVERLRQAFANAGVTAEVPHDIVKALWDKFLLVTSFGGVGAITRAPIGIIRTIPETRRFLEQCMHEVLGLARARQVAMAESTAAETMKFIDTIPAGGTTSLQRDIMDAKPSELDYWNGAVVRLGREANVSTPLHEFIYYSLLPQDLHARGKIVFPR
ncbi:MAG TPA: 2-dehydropantoate 2-reductase [Xanthobacteraceae bacterium]|jgi:2-dehydropantoate 2-reductase